jgi:hypothetical protein
MAKQKVDKEKSRLLTPEFRVSYPHVFKPNSIKGSKPKFSVTMLFDKKTDLTPIKNAIRAAKIAAFGSKENWPDDLESPVLDGDGKAGLDRNGERKEGYKGCWAIKASTGEDQRPGVVDENVEPITEPGKFYPGCFARAYVYAYVWDNEFGRGVGFILDHVQKLRDGKSFGGKKPADQVFTPVNAGPDNEDDDGDFESDGEADFM